MKKIKILSALLCAAVAVSLSVLPACGSDDGYEDIYTEGLYFSTADDYGCIKAYNYYGSSVDVVICDKYEDVPVTQITSNVNRGWNSGILVETLTVGKNVSYIEKNYYIGLDNLTSLTFRNTDGWYVSLNYDGSGSTIKVDVSDSQRNAKYFTDTFFDYYWFNDTVEVFETVEAEPEDVALIDYYVFFVAVGTEYETWISGSGWEYVSMDKDTYYVIGDGTPETVKDETSRQVTYYIIGGVKVAVDNIYVGDLMGAADPYEYSQNGEITGFCAYLAIGSGDLTYNVDQYVESSFTDIVIGNHEYSDWYATYDANGNIDKYVAYKLDQYTGNRTFK